MITIRNIKYTILAAACLVVMACEMDPMDDYKQYLDGGEIFYTGKVDSVKAYSGNERIKLSWLLTSDPKITKYRIFWDNRADTIENEVKKTTGVDTVTLLLDEMNEGSYNFEILTFDDQGNSSIPVYATGRVYGPMYKSSLLNRPVNSARWQPGGSVFLEWGAAELSVIGMKVTYTDNTGSAKKLFITADESSTELPDYKTGSAIEYQTLYKPEPTAIDTFHTETQTAQINEIYLNNSGYPFEYSEWDGERWGYPKDWIINDSIKNQGGYGGFDGYKDGGYLSMEKWSSSHAAIINGKIYKVLTLPAGTYSFEATFSGENSGYNVKDEAYLTVAEGNTFIDIDNVGSALGYADFETAKVEFTLAEEKEISIGFLVTFIQDKQNFRCHSVRLYKTE